jgi:hypothetical protein
MGGGPMLGWRRPTRVTHRPRIRGGLVLVVFALAAGVITQGQSCDLIGNPANVGIGDPCHRGTQEFSYQLCTQQGRRPYDSVEAPPSGAHGSSAAPASGGPALSVGQSPSTVAGPTTAPTPTLPVATPQPSVDLSVDLPSPAPSVGVPASYAGTYSISFTNKDQAGQTWVSTLKFTVDETGALSGTYRQVAKHTTFPSWQWDFAVKGTVDATGRVAATYRFLKMKDLSKVDDMTGAPARNGRVEGTISDGVFTPTALG